MINSKELLNSINSTVQMGQIGIRSVLEASISTPLRNALRSQLREYDLIETQAHQIAASRGWELQDVNPAVRKMADMTAKMRLACGNTETKIAAMMIRGNTRGMIIGLQDQHRYPRADSDVRGLSQKLLDCEHGFA